MFILIMLLVIGFGLAGLKCIDYILKFSNSYILDDKNNTHENFNKNTQQLVRIAFFSFIIILLSLFILILIKGPQ